MRCLEKDPDQRWQSADEMLAQTRGVRHSGARLTGASVAGNAGASALPRWILAAALSSPRYWSLVLVWSRQQQARERRWAREAGAFRRCWPSLSAGQWDSAWVLARRVEAVNPADSTFRALRPALLGGHEHPYQPARRRGVAQEL